MADDDPLLYLRRSDVQEIIQTLDCVKLLREAFSLHASGETIVPEEAYLSWRKIYLEYLPSGDCGVVSCL
jgi:ornithine cyclodeaminase/alanine dehydrogenase-like protein (mu-crystallin family)